MLKRVAQVMLKETLQQQLYSEQEDKMFGFKIKELPRELTGIIIHLKL